MKNKEIEVLKSSFDSIIEMKEWKNQRLDLFVSIKKYLFQFNDVLSTNLSKYDLNVLHDTIEESLSSRKQNYLNRDSNATFHYNCSKNSSICFNGTLS